MYPYINEGIHSVLIIERVVELEGGAGGPSVGGGLSIGMLVLGGGMLGEGVPLCAWTCRPPGHGDSRR